MKVRAWSIASVALCAVLMSLPASIASALPPIARTPGASSLSGGLSAKQGSQSDFPEITSVTPVTLTQGQSGTLLVTGRHLHTNMRLRLGDGVTTGMPTPLNDTMMSVQVNISPTAVPGVRTVQVLYKEQLKSTQSRVTIVSAYSPPLVRSVSPASLSQEQTATLVITGTGLQDVTAVDLGPGIQTDPPAFDGSVLRVKVTVVRTATANRRIVTLLDAKGRHPSSAGITVIAAQRLPVGLPASGSASGMIRDVTVLPAPKADVISLTPGKWQPGKSYQVTLRGSNLPENLQVRFGTGLSVENLRVTSGSTANLQISVSPKAAAGPYAAEIRPGVDQPWTRTRAMGVVEVAAAPAVLPAITPAAAVPLAVTSEAVNFYSLSPNRWYPDQRYDVTLYGANFPPDLKLAFGKDIVVETITVHDPSRATLKIQVGAKTLPGVRTLTYQTADNSDWRPSSTKVLLQGLARKINQVPPIQFQELAKIEYAKGEILLETPEFGKYLMMENAIGDHGIPKSNDQTRFTWKEKNPGLSERFELRIVDRDGRVLLKRTIGGTPLPDSFYAPDAEFLVQLFDLVRSTSGVPSMAKADMSAKVIKADKKALVTLLGKQDTAADLSPQEQYLADHWQEIDCFWEVVGLRRYAAPGSQSSSVGGRGVSQVKMVQAFTDVEVAVSERWPLKLPTLSPTGLACSAANTQFTYGKAPTGGGAEVLDNNVYVGDTVRVSGDFSLDDNPWGLVYETQWGEFSGTTGTSFGTTPVQGWALHNVFIDWGDGEYDRVTATLAADAPAVEVVGNAHTMPYSEKPPTGKLHLSMEHMYRYSHKFPVRVFVLPEEDVGLIDSIVQASRMDENAPVQQSRNNVPAKERPILLAAAGNSFTEMSLGLGKKLAVSSNAKLQAHPGFSAPGSRAFLLYCNAQIIDVKADPAATGPLHLQSIQIIDFSGQSTSGQTSSGSVQGVLPPSVTHPRAGSPGTQGVTGGGSPAQQQGASSGFAGALQVAPATVGMTENLAATASNDIAEGILSSLFDAVASSCDEALYARARLTYYGQGSITLRWRVDGVIVEERQVQVGPSPIRTQVDAQGAYTDTPTMATLVLPSPTLPLDPPGQNHTVTVEAELGDGQMLPSGFKTEVKGGVVIQVPIYDQVATVEAEPKTYVVTAPKPGQPCAFQFAVADGGFFKVSGLQGRASKSNGRWSGRGTLFFSMPDGQSGMARHYVDIDFQNWLIPDDVTVTEGAIHATGLHTAIDDLPGVSAVLSSLNGQAGGELVATMDIAVKDSGIRVVGSVNSSKPPAWSGLSAPLIPEDGWYIDGQSLPLTQIYWSLFQVESGDVRIDLSRGRGEAACAGPAMLLSGLTPAVFMSPASWQEGTLNGMITKVAGAGPTFSAPSQGQSKGLSRAFQSTGQGNWVGVNLGQNASLFPYLFNLQNLNMPVSSWGIDDGGICGRAHFGQFSSVLGAGSISFDAIDIKAGDHKLDATYQDMRIKIPWPALEVSGGDATLSYSQGDPYAQVDFQFNTQGLVASEDYGELQMTAQVKDFKRMASGWGITTDTAFEFRHDKKAFADTLVNDLFFNMDGFAVLPGDAESQSRNMSQTTKFGGATLDLQSLTLAAYQAEQAPERLAFTLSGKIFFPGLSSAATKVLYAIRKPQGSAVSAVGPTHTPFTVNVSYPPGQPMVETTVSPVINQAGTGVQDTFNGKVSSKMFGMSAPVEATFRYGAYNGHEYWLTYLKGKVGLPIYPGVILAYVNGGLAYGFDADVFTNDALSATPNQGSSMVYSAGVTVASADETAFEMSGRLTVSPADSVYRMDFDEVKLLQIKLAKGFFVYANGAFTGNLWGGFSLYGGAISCQIPANSNQVGLYFSDDSWEIWAGRQNTPINIHLLILDTQGYLQLGSQVGYKTGGTLKFNTGKVCLGIFAGRLEASAGMAMAISPGGHLSADFAMSAGVHAYVPCSGKLWDDSFSKSANLHVEVPPLSLSASVSVGVPKWVPGVGSKITLRFKIH